MNKGTRHNNGVLRDHIAFLYQRSQSGSGSLSCRISADLSLRQPFPDRASQFRIPLGPAVGTLAVLVLMSFLIVVIATAGVGDDLTPTRHKNEKRAKYHIEQDRPSPDRQHIAHPFLLCEDIRPRNRQQDWHGEECRAEDTAEQNTRRCRLAL